jgi:hypothetical protein
MISKKKIISKIILTNKNIYKSSNNIVSKNFDTIKKEDLKNILLEDSLIQDKFIVLITSCHKNINRKNKLLERFNKLGLPYFIIYGNKDIEYGVVKNPLFEVKDLNKGVSKPRSLELHINVSDHYEGLTFKNFYAIKYIYENYPNINILKMDDDTEILDYITFKNYLRIFIKNEYDYAGNYQLGNRCQLNYHFGKCKSEDWNKTLYKGTLNANFCSGGCFLLSNNSIKLIIEYINKNSLINEIYDDKLIGDILLNKVKPIYFNFLNEKIIKW